MTRNPIVNALAAVGYIFLVALFISLIPTLFPGQHGNPLGAIAGFLSLFVFSAAVMGYLVVGMPLRLFLEGEKKEAVALFMKTLGVFALASAAVFCASFLLPPYFFGNPGT